MHSVKIFFDTPRGRVTRQKKPCYRKVVSYSRLCATSIREPPVFAGSCPGSGRCGRSAYLHAKTIFRLQFLNVGLYDRIITNSAGKCTV